MILCTPDVFDTISTNQFSEFVRGKLGAIIGYHLFWNSKKCYFSAVVDFISTTSSHLECASICTFDLWGKSMCIIMFPGAAMGKGGQLQACFRLTYMLDILWICFNDLSRPGHQMKLVHLPSSWWYLGGHNVAPWAQLPVTSWELLLWRPTKDISFYSYLILSIPVRLGKFRDLMWPSWLCILANIAEYWVCLCGCPNCTALTGSESSCATVKTSTACNLEDFTFGRGSRNSPLPLPLPCS